jgi:hypothetical protein
MGKYDALGFWLEGRDSNSVELSFGRISDIVGGLPPSAYSIRQWWANDSKVQGRAVRAAGWHVDAVDLNAQRVTFARGKVGGTRARRLGLE